MENENLLESIINESVKEMSIKKVMQTSDYHIPYMDVGAYEVMKQYAKDYKPDVFIINGDMVDFYRISHFDKNPDRKTTVKEELEQAKNILADLRNILPKKTKMYFLKGNHEDRLEKHLWNDEELYDLYRDYINMDNLLDFKKYKVNYIDATSDYWKKDSGHLAIGDTLIMHGDNRLNGAKGGKYAGYNTAIGLRKNVGIGHTHRLWLKGHSNGYDTVWGFEDGCLCQLSGTADWQHGFVTYNFDDTGCFNFELHPISNYKGLYTLKENKIYKFKK